MSALHTSPEEMQHILLAPADGMWYQPTIALAEGGNAASPVLAPEQGEHSSADDNVDGARRSALAHEHAAMLAGKHMLGDAGVAVGQLRGAHGRGWEHGVAGFASAQSAASGTGPRRSIAYRARQKRDAAAVLHPHVPNGVFHDSGQPLPLVHDAGAHREGVQTPSPPPTFALSGSRSERPDERTALMQNAAGVDYNVLALPSPRVAQPWRQSERAPEPPLGSPHSYTEQERQLPTPRPRQPNDECAVDETTACGVAVARQTSWDLKEEVPAAEYVPDAVLAPLTVTEEFQSRRFAHDVTSSAAASFLPLSVQQSLIDAREREAQAVLPEAVNAGVEAAASPYEADMNILIAQQERAAALASPPPVAVQHATASGDASIDAGAGAGAAPDMVRAGSGVADVGSPSLPPDDASLSAVEHHIQRVIELARLNGAIQCDTRSIMAAWRSAMKSSQIYGDTHAEHGPLPACVLRMLQQPELHAAAHAAYAQATLHAADTEYASAGSAAPPPLQSGSSSGGSGGILRRRSSRQRKVSMAPPLAPVVGFGTAPADAEYRNALPGAALPASPLPVSDANILRSVTAEPPARTRLQRAWQRFRVVRRRRWSAPMRVGVVVVLLFLACTVAFLAPVSATVFIAGVALAIAIISVAAAVSFRAFRSM